MEILVHTFFPWIGIPDNIFINRETHYRVQ